jgi:hypothetical protein
LLGNGTSAVTAGPAWNSGTSTLTGSITGNAATVTTDANLTGPITSSGNATSITANAVTYGDIQKETTNTLLGNTSGSSAAPEELTIGSGITVTGTTLSVTGAAPTGAAGGDLGSNYPSPTVVSVAHVTTGTLGVANGGTGATTLTSGDLLLGNGTGAVTAGPAWNSGTSTLTGNITGNSATVTTNANLTGPITSSGNATTITAGAVTYANIQNEAANSLLGNPTGSSATPTEITLGSGLSFSSGKLTATGSGGTVTSVGLNENDGANIFQIGSPVTTSGNINIAFASEGAHQFIAGPAIGGPATPGFRSIVPADLPIATTSTLGVVEPDNTTIQISAGGVITAVGAPPTGSASGDLTGNYPGPTIAATAGAGNDIVAALNVATPTTPIDVAAGGTGVSTVSGVNKFFAKTSNGSVPAFRSIGSADLPAATSSTFGVVEPDNNTITISGGVITAIGAAPSGFAGGDLGGSYPTPTVLSVAHVTTGTLGVANGGTGAATLTSGDLLLGNGTSAVTAGPAWNSGTSTLTGNISGNAGGTAANVTGTVAIANGGTGQTTATAAFKALSPMTTAGDIEYENATPTPARLGIGSPGQVLTVVSGLPSWQTLSSGSVTSVAVSGGTTGLTTSGGPITSSGTITLAGTLGVANGGTGLTSTSQNFVFAGPTSGSGAPTWRLLAAGDIPSLSGTYLPLAGGTMSGAIAMGGNNITGGGTAAFTSITATPTSPNVALTIGGSSSGKDISATNWSVTHGGVLTLGTASNSTGSIVLANNSNAFTTTFSPAAGTATASTAYTLPPAGPSLDGQVLSSTMGGTMSWSNSVTGVSIASGNGFAQQSSTGGSNPAITIETTQTGVLVGNGIGMTGTTGTINSVPIWTSGSIGSSSISDDGATVSTTENVSLATGSGATATIGSTSGSAKTTIKAGSGGINLVGGISGNINTSVTTSYTVSASDYVIILPSITSASTLTLPTTFPAGRIIVVVVNNPGSGNWSTSPSYIDVGGSSSNTLAQDNSYTLMWDGSTNWYRIAK